MERIYFDCFLRASLVAQLVKKEFMLTVACNYEALEVADLRNHLQINTLEKMYLSLLSQKAGKVAWYSHLFKNFPQSVVIHTVKGFGVVNKAEVDVFLELSCFFDDPTDVGNLISGSSAFSKFSLNIWKFTVHEL